MKKAARYGDIFLTVTGDIDIITEKHFMEMKDGAICANAGHFDCEVSRKDLERISDSHYEARKNIEAYILPNGNTIYLMAEGRLVNLAAGGRSSCGNYGFIFCYAGIGCFIPL